MMEATIALALLLLGVLGMGALAGATVTSNVSAQDRTQAQNLAERLLGMLRVESLGWNNTPWNPGPDVSPASVADVMPLLGVLPANDVAGTGGFREITQYIPGTAGNSQAFTYDLMVVAPNTAEAKFCAHYSLTWLQPNETMRADVRVYWVRRSRNAAALEFYANCGRNKAAEMAVNVTDLFCVPRSVVLSRNEGGGL
jgi:hypothetical protein